MIFPVFASCSSFLLCTAQCHWRSIGVPRSGQPRDPPQCWALSPPILQQVCDLPAAVQLLKARLPVLITSLHAALYHIFPKGESLNTMQGTWTVSSFASSGCFYSPSSVGSAELHLHSAASEHLSWESELNSTTLLIISSHSPKIHAHPQQYLPFASRPLAVPKGQIKRPGRRLPIFPLVYNDCVLSPLWVDASFFVITFSKTMLMFVLCMKCLHNSLMKVLHSSYYTQLFFWNQESNHRWPQICPGSNQHHIKAYWLLSPVMSMEMMGWPRGHLLAVQPKWHI